MIKNVTVLITLFILFGANLYSDDEVRSGYKDDVEFSFSGAVIPGKWLKKQKVEYEYNGKKYTVLTQVYFPKKYKKGQNLRTLIALHGFEDNYRAWGYKTKIETYADQYNFAVACPETGKTLFETGFYPETKYKWSGITAPRFFGEVFIKYLRSVFALASTREKTGILGVSTGGRGAIVVASLYSKLFTAVSGLSGMYDKVTQPKNRLISDIYGDYEKYKERWEKDDNIIQMVKTLGNTAVFLFHGGSDYTFSDKQSLLLAIRLNQVKKKAGGSREIVYKRKKYLKHEWKAWNYVLEDVMKFFDNNLSKE